MHVPSPRSPAGLLPSRRPPDRTRRVAAGLVAVAWLLPVADVRAVDAGAVLDTPVTAMWSAVPLRAWAGRVSQIAGRPVVVDRRLDPDWPITRDCRGEPLGRVLAAVAAEAGATVEPLASSIRIGPTAAAGRATRGERDRAAEIARLPAKARAALAARGEWSWADGARPRDLVATAAAEAGVELRGLEAVPHDHLPAAALPPLALAERLDLVLADYDLRVAWQATTGGKFAGTVMPLAAAAAPPVVGPANRPPRRAEPAPPGGGERYTLTLEAPLDEALQALAPRLGLVAEIDRESLAARGILPGEIVRAAVTDATREQLLDALVAPLGLRWRIDGERLVVDAAP